MEAVIPKITGVDKVKRRIEGLAGPEKIELVGRALFAGGEAVKAEAQNSITEGATSGKFHVPSAPGEPPNENTGTLRRNITVTQVGPLHVRVASNALYSSHLEFGTSKMAARPFMGPAARKVKPQVVKLVGQAVTIAIRKGK
jgi:HK97 gp10 family phage protein